MTLALWDLERPTPHAGHCLCGGELPKRPAYREPAKHCSYWCALVEDGPEFYTLDTIAAWLKGNRPTSDAARGVQALANVHPTQGENR